MIYEKVEADARIGQGDIFRSLPLARFDPNKLAIANPSGQLELGLDWLDEVKNESANILSLVKLQPVSGIVITQDCDAARDDFVAFFQVKPFSDVVKSYPSKKDKWVKWITRHSRIESKWFYLPPDLTFGFDEMMAVDFQVMFSVPTDYLLKHIEAMRICRLRRSNLKEGDNIAREHFREKVSSYFRRYAYDEWYPLTKEEFDIYTEDETRKGTPPFDWQK